MKKYIEEEILITIIESDIFRREIKNMIYFSCDQ
jgi:hypothetical protein